MLMTCISIGWLLYNRFAYSEELRQVFKKITTAHWLVWLFSASFIIMAIFQATKLGDNLDEGAYYLPLVRWIENYPVVPGTAWFIDRMGYNSAYHMSNAVFGQSWLFPSGIYSLTPLLFIWINIFFLSGFNGLLSTKGKWPYPELLMLTAMVIPFSFLNDSMDSDYPNLFIGFLIIIIWLRKIKTTNFWELDSYSLLIMSFGLYLITVRLFSALFLILPLCIIFNEVWNKKFRNLWLCIFIGSVYMLPWLVRNYYLTGYLVYPFYFIDWFTPDWKLPLSLVKNNYTYIGTYAKNGLLPSNYLYEGLIIQAFPEWLPSWVNIMKSSLLDLLVLIMLPLCTMVFPFTFKIKLRSEYIQRMQWLLFYSLLIIGLWVFKFPSVRFAWTWILAFMCLTLLILWIEGLKLSVKPLIFGLTVLIGLMLTRNLIREWQDFDYSFEQLIYGVDNPSDNYTIRPLGKLELKVAEGENCWGLAPPCQPKENPFEIEMRGTDIRDGFRQKR